MASNILRLCERESCYTLGANILFVGSNFFLCGIHVTSLTANVPRRSYTATEADVQGSIARSRAAVSIGEVIDNHANKRSVGQDPLDVINVGVVGVAW